MKSGYSEEVARSLRKPSLQAKKYPESADRWQARVNDIGVSISELLAIRSAS